MTEKFYNTINESGEELDKSKKQVSKQETEVLKFFQNNPNLGHSPSMIHKVILRDCPLTSIRRAITNLTDAGHLIKTDIKVPGIYGKKEHLWRLYRRVTIRYRGLFD